MITLIKQTNDNNHKLSTLYISELLKKKEYSDPKSAVY